MKKAAHCRGRGRVGPAVPHPTPLDWPALMNGSDWEFAAPPTMLRGCVIGSRVRVRLLRTLATTQVIRGAPLFRIKKKGDRRQREHNAFRARG